MIVAIVMFQREKQIVIKENLCSVQYILRYDRNKHIIKAPLFRNNNYFY